MQNPTYIYDGYGEYVVSLTVTNDAGFTDSIQQTIIVSDTDLQVGDLECEGELVFDEVKPGSIIYGFFTVENIGDRCSLLNWEIVSHPDWGTWTFTPDQGHNLTPEFGPITVGVTIVAPDDPNTEFQGEILVINSDDPSDYDVITVSLVNQVDNLNQKGNGLLSRFLLFLMYYH